MKGDYKSATSEKDDAKGDKEGRTTNQRIRSWRTNEGRAPMNSVHVDSSCFLYLRCQTCDVYRQ